jgi:outer membrane lipoprotein LolB
MTRRRWALACAALLLSACAQLPRQAPSAEAPANLWTGRLALQVPDDPAQSFSAGFELRGTATSGELLLLTPLGGTAAHLRWLPGSATLRSGGQERSFESLDALVAGATGTALPVSALFDWLQGTPTPVPGWQPDLAQLPQGRLRAQRNVPPPTADLRVVLDR